VCFLQSNKHTAANHFLCRQSGEILIAFDPVVGRGVFFTAPIFDDAGRNLNQQILTISSQQSINQNLPFTKQ